VPGVTEETVKQQLANLKASGDYARACWSRVSARWAIQRTTSFKSISAISSSSHDRKKVG
jgi:hypothetical protein